MRCQCGENMLIAKRSCAATCSRSARMFSDYKAMSKSLRDCYRLLNVQESCRPDEVKEAYLKLVKLHHPDSGSGADPVKFMQVKEAYKAVVKHLAEKRKAESAREEDEEEDEQFKHMAPQHRQYLSFEGIGIGTPSQREKQYRKFRMNRATEQVLDYRKQKLQHEELENNMMVKDVQQSKKIKITQAVERLVEDLIQESMAKGEFDNLSGKGKPLQKLSQYPYIDPMTHNLNRILIENGYQPEWIVRQKEIKQTIEKVQNDMVAFRRKLGESLTLYNQKQWNLKCEQFRDDIKQLNKMVDIFNLIVPLLNRQMLHYNPDKELAIILKKYDVYLEASKATSEVIETSAEGSDTSVRAKNTLFSWIKLFLK
ncbi:dnaJ homolog subfamily C member 28 [Scyliorhinus canicula]|uniref:dnaJ homolog subfamily C member 28 n=1 Tax=Scyliorhinus canicula TaxID=7830 RepID=UPI0018F767E0|nr:dnaJ homolog subfamily C member 28 [Scyliorhinus canicula]